MLVTYAPLETKLLTDVGIEATSFSGVSQTLSPTTSLIVTIFFMLIGGAAFYRYAMAGIYRLEASENGVRKSNEAFKSATLGVLGVFLMFLVFFTFNRDILLSDVGLGSLEVPRAPASTGGVVTTPPQIATVDPSVTAPPSGTIQQKIATAANSFRGTSTNVPGTNNGRSACAYAVNEVLKLAGLSPMGGLSVVNMESALIGGRGKQIPITQAVPGDLVIVTSGSGNHVGVCISNGCSSALSNSSSNAAFSWVSGPDFGPSYKAGVGRIYRVTN